ncbi:MAG: hypothetical protein E4H36_09615, partial [Spirochaetales bacterium]
MKHPRTILSALVPVLMLAAGSAVSAAGSREEPGLSAIRLVAPPDSAGPLIPAFSPGTRQYTIGVNSDIAEVTVYVEASGSPAAVVTVNGTKARPGVMVPVRLTAGENRIAITASAGSKAAKSYTIIVKREIAVAVIDRFQKLTFTDPGSGFVMGYRLFVPDNYDPAVKYPLVFFLHGAGESGSDNEAQLYANRGAVVWAEPEEQAKRPCFVLAPQNPLDPAADKFNPFGKKGWTSLMARGFEAPFAPEPALGTAYLILRQAMSLYSIDETRVYGTGLSMGAFGIFAMSTEYPGTFAALAAVCGGLNPGTAGLMKDVPVWLFHAEDDPVVPVRFSRDSVKALKAA